jgi:hypothetical protein
MQLLTKDVGLVLPGMGIDVSGDANEREKFGSVSRVRVRLDATDLIVDWKLLPTTHALAVDAEIIIAAGEPSFRATCLVCCRQRQHKRTATGAL